MNPRWVVDSIARNARLPLDDYILPALRKQRLVFGAPAAVPLDRADGDKGVDQRPPVVHDAPSLPPPPPPPPPRPPPLPAVTVVETVEPSAPPQLHPPPPVRPARPRGVHSTETDDNFLQNFLSVSRLHFIGSWRSHSLAVVARALADRQEPPVELLPGSRPTFVHIDLDCFFASVSLLTRPHLASKPVVVTHGNSSYESSRALRCRVPLVCCVA